MGQHRRHRSSRPPAPQAARTPQITPLARDNSEVAAELEVAPTSLTPMLDAASGQAAAAPPPAPGAPASPDGDPLAAARARVLHLHESGAFAGGQGEHNRGIRGSVAHGTNSSMLDGLEQSGGRVLSSADLASEDIARNSGEGSTFRGGSAAQSTVSVGVGESGFGAALAYGDASRSMNHYNPRRYTRTELDGEIETLERIEGGYRTNRRGDILDADVTVNNHGRMQTYTDRLEILRTERARRDALPEGDPGRDGGEASLQDHPIVFHLDSDGMTGETTSSNNVEGEVESGFLLRDHIQRAFVPLENVQDTRTRLRDITGRDVEVIPLEALDALPEGSNVRQARSHVLDELRRQDANHRGSRDVMSEWAAEGRTATTPEERQQMRIEAHERRERYIEQANSPAPRVPAWGEDLDDDDDGAAVLTRPIVPVGADDDASPVATRRIVPVGTPDTDASVAIRPIIPVGQAESDEPAVVVQRIIPVGAPAEEPVANEVAPDPGGRGWHDSIGRTASGEAQFDREAQRTSAEATVTTTRRTHAQETSRSGTAGVDAQGRLTGHVERRRTFQDHQTDASERSSDGRTTRAGWNGEAAELRRTRDTVVHDDDGRTATQRQATLRVGRDRLEVGGAAHRERDIGDGSGDRRRVGVNGSVDVARRRATVGVDLSRRDASGSERMGGAASGTIDLDENNRIEEASGSVSGRMPNVSITADGRYRCHASDPTPVRESRQVRGVTREQTTAWEVTWTRDLRLRASGNVGDRRGGGAGVRWEHADSGTQRFATQAEARAFVENIHSRIDAVAGTPTRADAAQQMDVGESVRESDGGGVDVNGHVSALDGFLNAGVTAGHDARTEREVTRGQDAERGGYVDVRVRAEDTTRLGVSLSSVGLGMGGDGEYERSAESTLRFYLDTPEGRAAFDAYQNGRPLPSGGWEVQSRSVGTETSTRTRLDILTGDASTRDSLADTRTMDSQGRVSRQIRGRQTTQSSGIVEGHNHNETEFRAGVPADGSGQRYYRIAARAGGTDGNAVEDDLARATGVGRSGRDVQASGNWTVEQRMTPQEVDRFARTVRDGHANTDALLADSGEGEALRAALTRARGDRAEEARAIGEFISHTGPRGMAWLRNTTDISGQTEVVLHGDRFLRGGEAKRALEARIARYRNQLGDSDVDQAQLARHIRGDLRGARARLAAIRDEARYEDLPDALRAEEREWSEARVRELQGLAADVVRAAPSADSQQEEADLEHGAEAGDERRPNTPEPLQSERLTELQEQAVAARQRADAMLHRLETSEGVHLRGTNRRLGSTGRIPVEQFGEDGGILWTDGEETEAYARAASQARAARRTHRAGQECMRHAEDARSEGAFATGDRRAVLIRQVSLQLRTATATYRQAGDELHAADQIYRDIASRHRDAGGVWGSYQ